jgi:hypothetical protein
VLLWKMHSSSHQSSQPRPRRSAPPRNCLLTHSIQRTPLKLFHHCHRGTHGLMGAPVLAFGSARACSHADRSKPRPSSAAAPWACSRKCRTREPAAKVYAGPTRWSAITIPPSRRLVGSSLPTGLPWRLGGSPSLVRSTLTQVTKVW